jgi:hypothetical protein
VPPAVGAVLRRLRVVTPPEPHESAGGRTGPFGAEPVGRRGGRDPGGDAGLAGWVAELATDEAARSRTRAHWLGRQAAEEGTFAGVLEDLAERCRPVVVHLHNGRLHRGAAVVVGADFVVLRVTAGRDVAIALSAVASVRTLPGEEASTGDRFVPAAATLAEMLSALVDERVRVMVIGLDARQAVSGELRAVGRDVLTVRLGGEGGTAYVALGSVAEISLVESG